MSFLYGAITGLLLFMQGLGMKIYARNCGEKRASEYLINWVIFSIGSVILLGIGFVMGSFSADSFLYGSVLGIFFFAMAVFYSKAVTIGRISLCNFIMALSVIIPIAFGAIFMKETISPLQYGGLVAFCIGAYFVCFGGEKQEGKVNKMSYVYIAIAGICCGLFSTWVKLSYMWQPQLVVGQYLGMAFVVASIIVGILVFVAKGKKDKELVALSQPKSKLIDFDQKPFIVCIVMLIFGTVFGNFAFSMFTSMVNTTIFFPTANGLSMLLAIAVSPIFKEKITLKTAIGIAIGVGALIMLNI